MLADIAVEQKFEVTYVDLPDPSLTGKSTIYVFKLYARHASPNQ